MNKTKEKKIFFYQSVQSLDATAATSAAIFVAIQL